ncbi:MAG: putative bifunctional diguanylate cyclase/phosphodiesterase [Betaproteobacteria bacterium]
METRVHPALWRDGPSGPISEALFHKLFDEAETMSIQGYLPDGTVIYWNHASETLYGYTAAEALGANLLDLIIPPAMRSAVAAEVHGMFKTGRAAPPSRLYLRHRDGHVVPVYSSHTVVAAPSGTPILFCMDTDMSALDRAEAELRVAATAFESQQGMVIADANGVVLRVNRAFSQITGYSAAEVVGRTPGKIISDRHPPKFYQAIIQSLHEAGYWQGEILSRHKNGEIREDWVTIAAVKNHQGQVTHYVATHTDITQQKRAEAKIIHLAFYDPLTQLPNRRLLLDRLKQAVVATQRNESAGALLFIDLDNFKTLNDTLGHDVGDHLLQQVAGRLKLTVREKDTVARLGGDEFVVMLEDLSPNLQEAANQAEAVGRKILASLGRSHILAEREYLGSVSIGVTLFGLGASSAEELMKQADLAMYQAKAEGRNTLRFFDPEMQAAVSLRAALLNGLREGLHQQQFQLFYQAQVDRGGRVVGAEALIRWECPGRGVVSPADFIPIAEESGLILPMGLWVLETACNQLASWAEEPRNTRLTLAVNVSAYQFSRSDFVDQVLEVLARTGANPRRLKLELTESLLVNEVDDVIAKMSALKQLGVSFALDDFGTGYSSLSYLRRLPLDQLKIDQSFVRDLLVDANSTAIARTIIVLSQTMGFAVIAEGVETEAQRDLLAQLGCNTYQGYLFSRPLRLSDFQRLVG